MIMAIFDHDREGRGWKWKGGWHWGGTVGVGWDASVYIMEGEEEKGWSSRILLERSGDHCIYYLPCYLRMKLKNFLSLSPSAREAEINADLLFSTFTAGLPAFLLKELENGITLQFNRSEAIRLERSMEVSCVRREDMLSWTVRRRLKCAIDGSYFWAPFQLIYLALVVTVRSIALSNPTNGTPVTLRFNLMSHPARHLKVSLTHQHAFASYCLAPRKITVYYSRQLFHDPDSGQEDEANNLITVEDDLQDSVEVLREWELEEKVGYFQYCHFVMPMYRRPFVAVFTIYLPLWSLSLYSLFMYYQDSSNLSMRIANGMVIIVTVFQYVPTIRDQLPSTPTLLLTELVIYFISLTFILNLIQGTLVKIAPPQPFLWSQDPFYIATLVINLLSATVVLLLSLLHKFKWEGEYLEEGVEPQPKFLREEWGNEECDRYFRQFAHIRPIDPHPRTDPLF